VQKLLAGFRTVTIVVLLIFLPASVVGGAFLASRALRPVQHLTAAAEEIVATRTSMPACPPVERATNSTRLCISSTRCSVALIGCFEECGTRWITWRTTSNADDAARQKAQTAIESAEDIETAREALADCVEEADRAMTLLNTLMDIAEAEAGLIASQRRPGRGCRTGSLGGRFLLEVAEEKGVTLTIDVPSDLCVSGDAGSLRRVFANLLDNAIKYTPAGGRVRITTGRAEGGVAIHFTDSGSGIPAEDLPRIWDRLFRGDESRSERGLGLGLSFVRAIVESHGGTATISSRPGFGTKATIVLPAETIEGSAHKSPARL
jgi:hypothetical protein